MNGRKVEINSPQDAVKCGIGYLSEDRKRFGIVVQKSVAENSTMAALENFTKGLFINKKKEKNTAQGYVDSLATKTPSTEQLVVNLSGGNQQKVILGRWLLTHPDYLILDEPTNGLDPSGIHEIRELVKSLPGLYDCTILISSHMLSEIELMADDIGILNHGRLLFEGSLDELRQTAVKTGFAANNLEDVFLSMVDQDNKAMRALPDRKQRAKL